MAVNNQWGIYKQDGTAAFAVDSFITIHYENATKISTFPVEVGSFASYNKVQSPYKAKVKLSVGGNSENIENFIADLDSIVNDTNLYNVVTPEKVYLNANIMRVSYSREHNKGLNLILASLELMEVRQVTPAYGNVKITTSAKNKKDSDKKHDGKQQEAPVKKEWELTTQEAILDQIQRHQQSRATAKAKGL